MKKSMKKSVKKGASKARKATKKVSGKKAAAKVRSTAKKIGAKAKGMEHKAVDIAERVGSTMETIGNAILDVLHPEQRKRAS